MGLLRNFLGQAAARVVAACDVNAHRSAATRRLVDGRYGGTDCADSALAAEVVCQARAIALELERLLEWDPAGERFVGDAEANRMLSRAMRAPWHL